MGNPQAYASKGKKKEHDMYMAHASKYKPFDSNCIQPSVVCVSVSVCDNKTVLYVSFLLTLRCRSPSLRLV